MGDLLPSELREGHKHQLRLVIVVGLTVIALAGIVTWGSLEQVRIDAAAAAQKNLERPRKLWEKDPTKEKKEN